MSIQVLVVDDHELLRAGMRSRLEQEHDIAAVGEAATADQAVSKARSMQPALLVLSGIVSIVFGVVMFAMPGTGALVLLALIAAFALVTGLSELVVAIGGRRLVEKRISSAFAPPKVQPSH